MNKQQTSSDEAFRSERVSDLFAASFTLYRDGDIAMAQILEDRARLICTDEEYGRYATSLAVFKIRQRGVRPAELLETLQRAIVLMGGKKKSELVSA